MSDVNERIVEQYLNRVRGWFTIVDIPYVVPYNYSNIDILAHDQYNNVFYDIEVKFRSAYRLPNNIDSITWLCDNFTKYDEFRNRKLQEFTGRKKAHKILVTTHQMLGKKSATRREIEVNFKKEMSNRGHRNVRVWYFDDIIPELSEAIALNGRYDSEILQIIRMTKTYRKSS